MHQTVRITEFKYFPDSIFANPINIFFRPLFKAFYYAFVMFDTIENAKKAVEEHRYPRIKGGLMSRALPYNLHAIRGEPGGKDVQSTSIFVRGFESTKWSHEDLYAKFCPFGKILSCKVSVDADHGFLGFGYIQYSKIEEAQKAIKEVCNQSSFPRNSIINMSNTHYFILYSWTSMT